MPELTQKELDTQEAKQNKAAKAGEKAGLPDEEAAQMRLAKTEGLRELREAQEAIDAERKASMKAATKKATKSKKKT